MATEFEDVDLGNVQGEPGLGLNWRGTWVAGTAYAVNDAFYYDGESFRVIIATSTSTNPASVANRPSGAADRYFEWVARKGEKGEANNDALPLSGGTMTGELTVPRALVIGSDGGDTATTRFIKAYDTSLTTSYINFGHSGTTNNSAEVVFSYVGNNNPDNYAALSLCGAQNFVKVYPNKTELMKPLYEAGQRVYSPNNKPMARDIGAIGSAEVIPAGADLNSYTAPGVYQWERGNHGTTNTQNAPIQYSYGNLLVYVGAQFVTQILTNRINDIWIRDCYLPTSEWGQWSRLYSTANPQPTVPKLALNWTPLGASGNTLGTQTGTWLIKGTWERFNLKYDNTFIITRANSNRPAASNICLMFSEGDVISRLEYMQCEASGSLTRVYTDAGTPGSLSIFPDLTGLYIAKIAD